MISHLIEWALNSRLVVLLLALSLIGVGVYSFSHVNVEAYPDPAPAIVEIVAQYPGASADEVEREVTMRIEEAVAGIPGLKETRSKSLFGLAYVSNQFDYNVDYGKAKQEVILRLQQVDLPQGVTTQISPSSPIAEIYEYTLTGPKDARGKPVYNLNELKALQDWVIQREFRRLPRIADAVSFGGTVKQYEIHPDPDRLKAYGITLQQVQNAIASSNANMGGDYLNQGHTVQVVRSLGLLGLGQNPMQRVWKDKEVLELMKVSPEELAAKEAGQTQRALALQKSREVRAARAATKILRDEENHRIQEIRQIVLATTNNVPVRVEHIVEGGPLQPGGEVGKEGVVVGYRTRMGQVAFCKPLVENGKEVIDQNGNRVWDENDDVVQSNVFLRKGEESLPALAAVKAKVKDLNENVGQLLPGVRITPYYDRTELIDVTRETVSENLLFGMLLVSAVLLMILNNVRSSVIVAINIPLALLFAFAVLYLRGKSANLLSIGAVDFGIIVDSSVIMVENIYRHLSSTDHSEQTPKERILRACREVERSLFFSTIIMVCALMPLFTMKGPEGQIFGPMAETYAFALGGALLLALTVSPVLALLLFRKLKPSRDNFIVRFMKRGYLWQLHWCLNNRFISLTSVFCLIMITVLMLPLLGREFMPELEEGNMYIRTTFPANASLEEVTEKMRLARRIMQKYPECQCIMTQAGRPDDGTDPTGFYNAETLVPLKPFDTWPAVKHVEGWRSWFRNVRPRTKAELVEEMNAELNRNIIGVDWNFSQDIRDNVMEVLSGVKGENSVKIIGPDLDELERYADQVKSALAAIPGIEDAGVLRIKGQSNLEFAIDREKCAAWNVSVADVQKVIETAVGGKAFTQIKEGEKRFDVTLRWPAKHRDTESLILDIPVDIANHTVTQGQASSATSTPATGAGAGLAFAGTSLSMPALTGSGYNATLMNMGATPRRRLRDFVTPLDDEGRVDSRGKFTHAGASVISREQGSRLIAVKFSVRGRDLASTVAQAQKAIEPILKLPYRADWSGEFQEMEEAERRMILIVSLSLVLIVVFLYLAFRSLLDALVVLSNVVAVSLGGIWALLLTGANFNISAAVGFISILGVAILNGLLMVSTFNALRAQGLPLREAITRGVEKLVRPITLTALAAILGLLPAAFSTRIGSESQKPLAIAVVGGMLMTLLLANLVPILYSFYGHREPNSSAGQLSH